MLEPQSPVLPDAALLERLAERDSTALIELERRHRDSLYAQAYGILTDALLAEQVVHDAFTELWYAAAGGVGKRTTSTWLREMTRELARAELALRVRDRTSTWRTDEADPDSRYNDGAPDRDGGSNASTEPPGIGYSEGEGGGRDGASRDARAW